MWWSVSYLLSDKVTSAHSLLGFVLVWPEPVHLFGYWHVFWELLLSTICFNAILFCEVYVLIYSWHEYIFECRMTRNDYLNTEEFINAVADELRAKLWLSKLWVQQQRNKLADKCMTPITGICLMFPDVPSASSSSSSSALQNIWIWLWNWNSGAFLWKSNWLC